MNLSVLFKLPWLLVAAALVLLAVLVIILWQLDPVAFQDDAAVTQAHFTVAARLTEAVMATQTKAGNPDQTVETATSLPVHETPPATPSLVVQHGLQDKLIVYSQPFLV
jgi:hypothetical protein